MSVVAVANATGYEYRLKGAGGAADGPWTAVSHTHDASLRHRRLPADGARRRNLALRGAGEEGRGARGPASAVQTVTLTDADSSTGQAGAEPLRFLNCDTGTPLSGRLRLPPTAGQQVAGYVCYEPASTSPTSFGLGEFPLEHEWGSSRRADAGQFSAGALSTITVGGVELYRRAISFNAASGPDGGGPDGDYIWIFEAQVSRGSETDVNEVYVRDGRSPHPAGAAPPRCRRRCRCCWRPGR